MSPDPSRTHAAHLLPQVGCDCATTPSVVEEIRSALADPDHKSDTPQQFQRHFWPPADEPPRDELIALLKRADLYYPIRAVNALGNVADAVLAAGWGNLERFRHEVTNALGMAMVHEADDPDLGYDRGITDAMDIVNALNQTESWFAEDVHACAKCGHAARQHPFPHCEWWVGDEDAAPEPTRLIGGDAAMPKDTRSPDEIQRSALSALGLTAREDPPKPEHAPFELQGGDLHGFRFCQACRKTWPCGEQARKGDPNAHIQHGGAL